MAVGQPVVEGAEVARAALVRPSGVLRVAVESARHGADVDRRRDDLDLKVRLKLTRGRRLCHGCQMPVELYPDGHGKVKSPMCCGDDMSCPIG